MAAWLVSMSIQIKQPHKHKKTKKNDHIKQPFADLINSLGWSTSLVTGQLLRTGVGRLFDWWATVDSEICQRAWEKKKLNVFL